MPTTTARGLVVPNLTGDGADLHQMFLDLANSIEAMNNSALVLGSTLTAVGQVKVDGAGPQTVDLRDTTAGADLKRSRLRNDTAKSYWESVNDAYSAILKTGATLDHATGVVDHPNGLTGKRMDSPYFRAYRSTAVSYATGATVVFNTETDPNGWYDNTTGIFLPTVAGMYRVSWRISSASLSSGNYLYGALFGSIDADTAGRATAPGAAVIVSTSGSTLVPMNGTSDSLHVTIDHNQGGALAIVNTSDLSHFEAERIGA